MQSEPVTLRPSLAAYLGRALTAPVNAYLVLGALIVGVVVSGLLGSVVFWTGAAVGLTSEVVRVAYGLRRERIEFGGGTYRVRESDGRWKSFAASQIGEAIVVRASGRRGGEAPISRLYLRSRDDGTRLFRMSGALWRGSDLALLGDDLREHGVAVESLSERTALETLGKKHPWALERWEAHFRAISVIVALMFVAALAVERFLT
ncbi:hypothetical protein [Herbiconiux sp. L3-i23]|uniref:hypothetical protein n=1 Tax=Herbiconiux sp. L3-i23 TaxID=2905871 RepID=UPI002055FCB7|nr:hypothetical protein [Herbiconiux sp. L3-i23]BDI21890.1 hypothetical protein L3i23_06660 [Herbiconiux sp. L3-i23]